MPDHSQHPNAAGENDERIIAPAKLLLTKKELSRVLPMPVRTIEKLVSAGVLPALKITPRMVRFELSAVMAALRRHETATITTRKK